MIFKNFKFDLSNKNKKLIPQVLTVISIFLIVIYFTINAQNNMGNRGISFGFGFLSQESSFDIAFSLIEFDGSHSYARAFLVGLLNTILVSAINVAVYMDNASAKEISSGIIVTPPLYT